MERKVLSRKIKRDGVKAIKGIVKSPFEDKQTLQLLMLAKQICDKHG
jgi:hypothetical protein